MSEITELKDLNKKLKSISTEEWHELFALIPVIRRTKSFGKLAGGKKCSDGVYTMPYYVPTKVVSDFHKLVYEMGLVINFDWTTWEERRKIIENKNKCFNNLSFKTLCKLITTIVRAERFCDGFLIGRFKDETVLKILTSLEKKLKNEHGKSKKKK